MSRSEWLEMGKKAGWTTTAGVVDRYANGEMDDQMIVEISGLPDEELQRFGSQYILRMVKKMESFLYGRPRDLPEVRTPFENFKSRIQGLLS